MKQEFLGDSYDLVKRYWRSLLDETAPLYFCSRFVEDELWQEYSRVTTIYPLPKPKPARYSILNDPDTGLLLPTQKQRSKRSHITLDGLAVQHDDAGLVCSITFDQSFTRGGRDRKEQLRAKLEHLERRGLAGFYYASHACFLFAFRDAQTASHIRDLVVGSGIPDSRLEPQFAASVPPGTPPEP